MSQDYESLERNIRSVGVMRSRSWHSRDWICWLLTPMTGLPTEPHTLVGWQTFLFTLNQYVFYCARKDYPSSFADPKAMHTPVWLEVFLMFAYYASLPTLMRNTRIRLLRALQKS